MAETQHYKFPAPDLSEPADITEIGKAIKQIDGVMYDIDRFSGNTIYPIDISKVGSENNILWIDIPGVMSYDELDGKIIAINTGVYCCTRTTPQALYINVNGLGARAIRRPLPSNGGADYDTNQYYTDKYVKGEISRSQTLMISFSGTTVTLLNPAPAPRATTSITSNSTDDVSYVTPKLIAENQSYTFTLHLKIGEEESGSFQLSGEDTYDSSELEFSDVPCVYISDDFNNTYKVKLPQSYSSLNFGGHGDLSIEDNARKNVWLYLTHDGIIFKDILTEKNGNDLDYFAGIDGEFRIYLCTVSLIYDVDYGWLPISRSVNGSNDGHYSIVPSAFEAKSVTQTLPDIVSAIGYAVRIKLESEIDKLESERFSGYYSDLRGKPANATTSTDGFMSSSDKAKLDDIDIGANNYTLPTASGSALGGVKLSDATNSTADASSGTAATPAAVKTAYDKAVEVGNTRIWNSSGVTAAASNSWALSSYKLILTGARNIALACGFSYDAAVEILGEGNLLAACGGILEFSGGVSAIIGGYGHKLNGGRAVILGGYNNIAHAYNVVIGKSCKEPTATDYNSSSGDLFVVGNGTANTRSNAFRVAANGNCYAGAAFNGTGADYNEVREWSDGNSDSEDRCGYMVAFVGTKIRLAQPGDNLRKVGIISGNSCITGNNFADYWHGKYKRDIYGRYETVPVHNDAEYDDDGNLTKEEYDGYAYVLSEDYDPSLEDTYTPRLDRSEYDLMATHGEVVVRDDGTCEADGYCIPGKDGIATKDSEEIGFYVMERIDENHIRVFVR